MMQRSARIRVFDRMRLIVLLMAAAAAVQAQTPAVLLAIRNVTVIPVASAVRPGSTVVIRNGLIDAIGPVTELAIPSGATVIDGTGKYLVPGFIDLHVHLSKNRASAMGLMVANGVTTVRDMGGDYEELSRWRTEVVSGQRIGPRILLAGPMLESAANIERMRKDSPSERVEPFERMRVGIGSPEEAWTVVARLAALRVDFIKIRTVQDQQTYLAINEAAVAHSLRVVGHPPPFTTEMALDAGQDGFEHGVGRPSATTLEARLTLWRRFAASGVPVTPTLITIEAALTPIERLRGIVADVEGRIEPRRRYLSKFQVQDWREQLLELSPQRQEQLRKVLDQRTTELREMHQAGVDILAGTDTGVLNVYPGSSLHDELRAFVSRLNMTPAEAIERATSRSARSLQMADRIGTVTVGKVADLVMLDADPLTDIANTRRIAGVFLRGRWHDRTALDNILRLVAAAPDLRTDDWGRK